MFGWIYHSKSWTLPGDTIASGFVVVAGLPVELTIMLEAWMNKLPSSASIWLRRVILTQSPWLARSTSG